MLQVDIHHCAHAIQAQASQPGHSHQFEETRRETNHFRMHPTRHAVHRKPIKDATAIKHRCQKSLGRQLEREGEYVGRRPENLGAQQSVRRWIVVYVGFRASAVDYSRVVCRLPSSNMRVTAPTAQMLHRTGAWSPTGHESYSFFAAAIQPPVLILFHRGSAPKSRTCTIRLNIPSGSASKKRQK